jgi:hypothetical protein
MMKRIYQHLGHKNIINLVYVDRRVNIASQKLFPYPNPLTRSFSLLSSSSASASASASASTWLKPQAVKLKVIAERIGYRGLSSRQSVMWRHKQSPYAVLGVSISSTQREIKKAYFNEGILTSLSLSLCPFTRFSAYDTFMTML